MSDAADLMSTRVRVRTASAPWRRIGGSALAVVVVLAAWELIARTVLAGAYVLPAPSVIAATLWADHDLFLTNAAATGVTAGIGYLLGQALAVVVALILSTSVALELVVTKLALVVYSLPTLAIAPILGTIFGLDGTRVAVVILMVFFPTLLATVSGLRGVRGDSVNVVRSLGGGWWSVMRKVALRTVLPDVFSGLKLGVPSAVLGAIASEWLGATQGLGIFMVNSLAYLQPARVWGSCVVLVVATLMIYAGVSALDRLVNGWLYASSHGGRS